MIPPSLLALFDPSNWSLTTAILVVTLCVLIQRLYYNRTLAGQHKLPPCPRFQLPFIGHLHLLSTDVGVPFRRFRQQLGDIYRLQLGNRVCIVLSGYDVIKDALVKNGDAFLDRPRLHMVDKISRETGVFMANGDKWKEHRIFTLKTLKDFGMGKSLIQTTIHGEIKLLFDVLDAEDGRPFDPNVNVSTALANILFSMVFGSTFQHGDATFIKLMNGIGENLRLGLLTGVVNFLPFLRWLPGDPFYLKKMIKNSNELLDFVKEVIDERKETLDEHKIEDFVSAYLKHMRDKDRSGTSTTFSFEDLAGTFGDLFGAGVETTATLITWCIPLMADHPEIQNRMFEEIRTHVGLDRLPAVDDRIKLPLIEAFFYETARYTQPTSVNVPRSVVHDVEFRGYHLPAGAIVMMNLGSILFDPEVWTDPYTFDPSRFLDGSGRLSKKDELLMFTSGKRSCIGEALARTEAFLFLSAIVQRYEILCPEGADVSMTTIDGEYRVIRAPKPFKVVFKKRN